MDADSAGAGAVKRFLGSLEGEHTLERVSVNNKERSRQRMSCGLTPVVSGLVVDEHRFNWAFDGHHNPKVMAATAASITGESTSRCQNHHAGGRADPAASLIRARVHFFAHGSRVPAGARPFRTLSIREGQGDEQSSGVSRRENAELCSFFDDVRLPCIPSDHRRHHGRGGADYAKHHAIPVNADSQS